MRHIRHVAKAIPCVLIFLKCELAQVTRNRRNSRPCRDIYISIFTILKIQFLLYVFVQYLEAFSLLKKLCEPIIFIEWLDTISRSIIENGLSLQLTQIIDKSNKKCLSNAK